MKHRRNPPEVNAGSMADIAFLLLIFFLVTTSLESNEGLKRMLPKSENNTADIYERNLLRININSKNQLFVADELITTTTLKDIVQRFLDNGGAPNNSLQYCDYCEGERSPESSDNPDKAIISLTSSRNASYDVYLDVQNQLMEAYNVLRTREALKRYKISYPDLMLAYANAPNQSQEKQNLKIMIEDVRSLYPLKISEAELKN